MPSGTARLDIFFAVAWLTRGRRAAGLLLDSATMADQSEHSGATPYIVLPSADGREPSLTQRSATSSREFLHRRLATHLAVEKGEPVSMHSAVHEELKTDKYQHYHRAERTYNQR